MSVDILEALRKYEYVLSVAAIFLAFWGIATHA